MSGVIVTPDELASAIESILSDFVEATEEVVDNAAKEAADHASKQLQTSSPHLTGDYQKGWAVKVEHKARSRGKAKVVVYNRTDYQLTHLLENGHAKVVYGHRVGGTVAPRVHIAPVEEAANDEFLDLIRSGIGK